MKFLSIVSGTSTDGITVLLSEITNFNLSTQFKILAGKTFAFPRSFRSSLMAVSSDNPTKPSKLSRLNWRFGELIIKAARDLNQEYDVITFSGHTIYHGPSLSQRSNGTLQIGDISQLVASSGKTGISDFRFTDMSYGGFGAPLIALSDFIILREKGTLAINIGGISNITYIGKNELIAFDTGPGNMLIDEAASLYYGRTMDKNANIAKKGKVIGDFLRVLMSDDYFDIKPPKNSGREYFGFSYLSNLKNITSKLKPADILRTLTRFTATSIHDQTKRYVDRSIKRIFVGGGGTKNPLLMKDLEELFRTRVYTFDDLGIPNEFREALGFAIIANQTLHGAPGRLISVNPMSGPILGKIIPGKNFRDVICRVIKEG